MQKKDLTPVLHKDFMELALTQALIAGEEGEVPVGAVLVRDGQVIASDRNRRDATGDPTAHAESLVLRQAGIDARDWRLESTTLYVTLEPCAMCAGAIVLARIGTVVFGASDPAAGAGGSAYNILEDGKLGHRVEVIAGVMETECRAILENFFGDKRP
jgi:tRNA(adenine34) deaminase